MPNQEKDIALAIEQLEILIRTNDLHDRLHIEGVILDYIFKAKKALNDIFDLNPDLYISLFQNGTTEIGTRLLRFLIRNQDDNDKLYRACSDKYPKVCDFLQKPAVVIWQISDIHFGDFNTLEKDPIELASILSKAAKENPEFTPDVILITGDVTSKSKIDEFKDFVTFCEDLGKKIWGKISPEKILLVPGNHDSAWKPNGKTDKLNSFIKLVAQKDCCITPFCNSRQYTNNEGTISINQYNYDNTTPPIVEVTYEQHDLRFILLTSCYYSGIVPEEVRKLFNEVNDDVKKTLTNLLRVDKGNISSSYLNNLASLDIKDDIISIAMIHHNPITYSCEIAECRHSKELMATLFRRKIFLLLHGHTHLCEKSSVQRPFTPGETYPISCTTLCSNPSPGSSNGMNIYFVNKENSEFTIKTFQWPISGIGFNIDEAKLRYTITVNSDEITVNHKSEPYKR